MAQSVDYLLSCRCLRDGVLRADVSGRRTPSATRAYWEELLVQVRTHAPRRLLVVDELRGPELSAAEWCALVEAMHDRGLGGVRIAHVRPAGMAQLEYCEICAREAGIDARAFDDLATAERWLRYGAPEPAADTAATPAGARRS